MLETDVSEESGARINVLPALPLVLLAHPPIPPPHDASESITSMTSRSSTSPSEMVESWASVWPTTMAATAAAEMDATLELNSLFINARRALQAASDLVSLVSLIKYSQTKERTDSLVMTDGSCGNLSKWMIRERTWE